jgi:hypothetical protein
MASAQWYGRSAANLIAAQWVTNSMGVMLMKPTFSASVDIDNASQMKYADVSAQEVASGGGYTTGGQAIANRTTSYNTSTDTFSLLGDDLSWGPGATFDTAYGIIYEMTGTNKWLWALLNFAGTVSISSGIFQIDWASVLLDVQVGAAV